MRKVPVGLLVLAALMSGAWAQTSDKLLQRCVDRQATAAEKARCKKELLGKSHAFSAVVVDFVGDTELKMDHPYGLFSHIGIHAAFGSKVVGKVRKDDRIQVVGIVDALFDDALNPMVSLKGARLK